MPILPPGTDNEAIRELRDQLKDLNGTFKKTNEVNGRFTFILIVVAFLQLLVGIFQFAAASDPKKPWLGVILEIVILIFAYYFIIKFEFKKKEK